jgi:hypothetical protein
MSLVVTAIVNRVGVAVGAILVIWVHKRSWDPGKKRQSQVVILKDRWVETVVPRCGHHGVELGSDGAKLKHID